MIVLWTARSIESEWVYEEASEGRRQDKLIPVLLEAVRPPAGFREIQAADLTDWDGTAEFEAWRLLVADLENLIGRPSSKSVTEPEQRLDDGKPAYDPDDLRSSSSEETSWPIRRLLPWGLALLVPVIRVSAFLLMKRPPPDVHPSLPDSQVSEAQPLPKPPAEMPQTHIPPERIPTPSLSLTTPAQPRVTTAARHPASSRCADLLSRIQLGESLSDEAQSVFRKECSR
jgi:hypothetical protein